MPPIKRTKAVFFPNFHIGGGRPQSPFLAPFEGWAQDLMCVMVSSPIREPEINLPVAPVWGGGKSSPADRARREMKFCAKPE
jgi:hypothetical protein